MKRQIRKKSKLKWYTFALNTFNCTVNVTFNDNWRELSMAVDSSYERVDARACFEFKDNCSVVDLYFELNANPSIIAHECYHVLLHVLSIAATTNLPQYDELGAHIFTYIVEQCHKIQEKATKKQKKVGNHTI